MSITAVSVASGGGSIVNNGNGTWSYTPAANYNGPVSFNYTASDGSLTSSSTASLTLAALNDAPVATPVALAAGTEDTTYTINASALLAGVTDVDHCGERGERRRQHRQQRQRHLELYACGELQRPGQLQLYRFRRLADLKLDRQPGPGGGQRRPGGHGGIADRVRGRHGTDHPCQYRRDGSGQLKLCLHCYQCHARHIPDHRRRSNMGQRHHVQVDRSDRQDRPLRA